MISSFWNPPSADEPQCRSSLYKKRIHELDKATKSETGGQLTTYIYGPCEGCGDLWIQFYDQVSILSYLVVPCFNALLNEVRDRLADDGEEHVDDPLPRQARHVTLIRQIVLDSIVLCTFFEESFDAETLVEWSV